MAKAREAKNRDCIQSTSVVNLVFFLSFLLKSILEGSIAFHTPPERSSCFHFIPLYLVTLTAILLSSPCFGQEQLLLHDRYTFARSVARDPYTGQHYAAVVLPPRTIVKLESDGLSNIPNSAEPYIHVVTQYGQNVLIPKSSVLEGTLAGYTELSRNFIIFNMQARICKSKMPCALNSGVRINHIIAPISETNNIINVRYLEGITGEGRTGYLTRDALDQYKNLGVLTDLRDQHFRMQLIDTRLLSSLDCNETEELMKVEDLKRSLEASGSAKVGFSLDSLLGWLGLSASTEAGSKAAAQVSWENKTVKVQRSGANDKAVQNKLITIVEIGETHKKKVRSFLLKMLIQCNKNNQPVAIETADVQESDENFSYFNPMATFEFKDFYSRPPTDDALNTGIRTILRHNGNKPFMVSINSEFEYYHAMRVLMNKQTGGFGGELEIGLIVLGELNASCLDEGVRSTCAISLPIKPAKEIEDSYNSNLPRTLL